MLHQIPWFLSSLSIVQKNENECNVKYVLNLWSLKFGITNLVYEKWKNNKTKQKKFENYFFWCNKKKTSKMCKQIYKHTNITNKQATNKVCTLKKYNKLEIKT